MGDPERRILVACAFTSVTAIFVSAVLHWQNGSYGIYSDIWSFWGRSWVSSGQVPYSSSNAFLEYPPISGGILYAARVIGGWAAGADPTALYGGYFGSFTVLSLVAAVAIAWSTWRLARALDVKLNPLYFLLPSFIVFGVYNFDLFNALFIVLGLQLFVEKRRGMSALAIGLAIATKFVAGILIPIFLLELTGWKERGRYLVVSLGVAAATFIPIAVFNWGYFNQFISFYSGWGLEDAWYIWIFGNPFSTTAKVFGYALMAVLILKVYSMKVPLAQRSFLALSAYLFCTSIYAPQFNVMLIPIIAVLALNSPWLYTMEVANALIILTWFGVPATATTGPTYPWTWPQTFALIRSASLGLLGLTVAYKSGHSFAGWFRGKLKLAPQPWKLAVGLAPRGPGRVPPSTPGHRRGPADFDP